MFFGVPAGVLLAQCCPLRSVTLTPTYRRSLFSPLQSIINALLNGQLVPPHRLHPLAVIRTPYTKKTRPKRRVFGVPAGVRTQTRRRRRPLCYPITLRVRLTLLFYYVFVPFASVSKVKCQIFLSFFLPFPLLKNFFDFLVNFTFLFNATVL